MRISELSARSGMTPASIKYYTREGLLPPGVRTGHNQTAYTDDHLARLRLIRALMDAGGLTVAAAQLVLSAIDDEHVSLPDVFKVAQHALPRRELASSPQSRARVLAIIEDRGWHARDDNPGVEAVAGILDAYVDLGRDDLTTTLGVYAEAADLVAAADLDALGASGSRVAMAETVVVGTVLGDGLLAGLRRIAQEHYTRVQYRTDDEEPQ